MIRPALISLAMVAPASALTLEDCTRTTHVSHGGEAGHRDIGGARVAWAEWWSQEGVYLDLHVADCDTRQQLTTRVHEENVSDRRFDRRDRAIEIVERHARRDPALFSLEALAGDLKHTGEDIRITQMTQEVCACAAAYPDTRVGLAPFALN